MSATRESARYRRIQNDALDFTGRHVNTHREGAFTAKGRTQGGRRHAVALYKPTFTGSIAWLRVTPIGEYVPPGGCVYRWGGLLTRRASVSCFDLGDERIPRRMGLRKSACALCGWDAVHIVDHDIAPAGFVVVTHRDGADRSRRNAQALKVIEGHAQVVGQRGLDHVGMGNGSDHL